MCTDTYPVVRSDAFCEDGCWESVQIRAREEEREQDGAGGERGGRAELRRWGRAERGGDVGRDEDGGYGGPPPPYRR